MPIHPDNRGRYPSDWREISRRIRFDRAGGRCECTGQCGSPHPSRCAAPHGVVVERPFARPWDWRRVDHAYDGDLVGRTVRIVLTVAHLDHTPENCDDANLLAMCQLCHLRLDASEHARSRRERRLRNQGKLDL